MSFCRQDSGCEHNMRLFRAPGPNTVTTDSPWDTEGSLDSKYHTFNLRVHCLQQILPKCQREMQNAAGDHWARQPTQFESWMHAISSMYADLSWNVMAHSDAREGKWRGNWRMEWVASTLHFLRTWCIQHSYHYYRWCTHLGCQLSIELNPPPI